MSRTWAKRLRFALVVGWSVFILIATAATNLPASWGNLPLQSPEIQLQQSNPEQADSLPEAEFQQEFQVSPQDPGYLAIKSLIKHYGCMSAYPDGHLGPRVELIRSEMVVDLNACLDRTHQMVAARLSKFAMKNQIAPVKLLLNRMANDIRRLKRKSYVSK